MEVDIMQIPQAGKPACLLRPCVIILHPTIILIYFHIIYLYLVLLIYYNINTPSSTGGTYPARSPVCPMRLVCMYCNCIQYCS